MNVRVAVRDATTDAFIRRYSRQLNGDLIFLATRSAPPSGTVVRFVFALGGATEILRGEGKVIATRPASGDGKIPPGMVLRFHALDDQSRAVVEMMRGSRGAAHADGDEPAEEAAVVDEPIAAKAPSEPAAAHDAHDGFEIVRLDGPAPAPPPSAPAPVEEAVDPEVSELEHYLDQWASSSVADDDLDAAFADPAAPVPAPAVAAAAPAAPDPRPLPRVRSNTGQNQAVGETRAAEAAAATTASAVDDSVIINDWALGDDPLPLDESDLVVPAAPATPAASPDESPRLAIPAVTVRRSVRVRAWLVGVGVAVGVAVGVPLGHSLIYSHGDDAGAHAGAADPVAPPSQTPPPVAAAPAAIAAAPSNPTPPVAAGSDPAAASPSPAQRRRLAGTLPDPRSGRGGVELIVTTSPTGLPIAVDAEIVGRSPLHLRRAARSRVTVGARLPECGAVTRVVVLDSPHQKVDLSCADKRP